MESYYLTIDSNSDDPRVRDNNSISSFVNIVEPAIEVSGEYEVALKEIQFPSTLFNITEEQYLMITILSEASGVTNSKHGKAIAAFKPFKVLEPGRYTSIKEIIDLINNSTAVRYKLFDQYVAEAPSLILGPVWCQEAREEENFFVPPHRVACKRGKMAKVFDYSRLVYLATSRLQFYGRIRRR